MTSSEKPWIYLVFGAAGSGRREVLVDLIAEGFEPGERVAVVLAETETPAECDSRLGTIARWAWRDERIEAELPPGATRVFFVTDGRDNPVEQIEAFQAWSRQQGARVVRTLCVVNCPLAQRNPPLLAWYEACVHFSDIVLLNRREGVENKWVSDFLAHFKKQYYPCLFELVKGSRVGNPALVLDPQARRMTHVFDEEETWPVADVAADEEESDEEDDADADSDEDPYFKRDAAGRRVKRLPDIARFL